MVDFAKGHPFLRTYLDYVQNTESPRVFHIWCAISAISACLGRRCWLPTGIGDVWPNMYVVLVGPPATKKGSAMKFARDLLERTTEIRYAPNDTGGQRQGLIASLVGKAEDEEDEELATFLANFEKKTETVNDIFRGESALEKLSQMNVNTRDKHTLYIASSELNSILGENNTAMLTFLQELYDGVPYTYKLRTSEYVIKDGLISILGGTTPTQMSLAMPPQAIGQGFMSRTVFVFDDRSFKKIPRPTLDKDAGDAIAETFGKVFRGFEGAFTESAGASRELDNLYMRGIEMKDPRFLHYLQRRPLHLQKTAMALAAGRGEMTIQLQDVQLADQILMFTEQYMPDALGEYGMNKLGAAKQRLLEYIKHSDGPIPTAGLYGLLSRDMSQIEYKNVLSELHNAKKITVSSIPMLGLCVTAVDETGARQARSDMAEIINFLEYKDK